MSSQHKDPVVRPEISSIVIRPARAEDAEAIARVRVDSWRETYRGMIPQAYLDAMKLEESRALWEKVLTAGSNAVSVFVAEHGADIVGFGSGNMLAEPKHGFDAELSAVYVRREFQGVGLGRRLVLQTAIALSQRARGASSLLVWVIAGNKRARAFYERLGAELVVEQAFQWDGMDLVEAGYGWRTLDALIAAPPGLPPSGTVLQ
ncbi:MAG TPA: GNAT family N-acetyltransferase [Casimicrobiaceae bacterium]|jgi:ribosomal protein S18 acetylase RimI-like enzyme|nr:GNAT family N-acetyltransferase [Casimicrobiaceae bacterium]